MKRSAASVILWMFLLLVAAMGLTAVAYLSLVPPEGRHRAFWAGLISSCAAELVVFAYIPYVMLVPRTTERPSAAVRNRVLAMVVLWTAAMIISGAIAAAPSVADTFYGERVVLFQMMLTFVLLLSAYMLDRQDVILQMRDAPAGRERTELQSYALDVERLHDRLGRLAGHDPAQDAELDELGKRLETLGTQLASASPWGERGLGRAVPPVTLEEVCQALRHVHEQLEQLTQVSTDQSSDGVLVARQAVDAALAILRHREQSLTL